MWMCMHVCVREHKLVYVCVSVYTHEEQEAPADERGRHVGRGTVGE